MATGIFYTTSTGNASEIAQTISSKLAGSEIYELNAHNISKINEFDKIIIGVSTWGDGELNDDFEDIWDEFSSIDFSNKTIALFGLGDQEGYPDEFCSAMGIIYNEISNHNIIGFTSIDEYDFDDSKAVKDGKFVGLVLDEDNQDHLTAQRIEDWIESIKAAIL